jgi:hypothetical protein
MSIRRVRDLSPHSIRRHGRHILFYANTLARRMANQHLAVMRRVLHRVKLRVLYFGSLQRIDGVFRSRSDLIRWHVCAPNASGSPTFPRAVLPRPNVCARSNPQYARFLVLA